VTVASALAHRARTGAHLTQDELAAFAGVHQPAVARAENGRTGLTVDSLDRLVRAAGWRLTVIPTRAGTVADAAEAVARFVSDAHVAATTSDSDVDVGVTVDGPYRAVIQLADDLAAEHGAERVALTVTPPAPTGDIRFDAFLAGVVETRLDEEHLPHPRWLATAPRLLTPWLVDPATANDREAAYNATPAALAKRGVIIAAEELASV